jgi:hypothetical protein
MRRRTLALVLTPALALAALTACSDSANEQAVENAIESANPSIDADVSDDGKGIEATDDSGNSISAGSAAEVPDDFPSAVPLPSGLTLGSVVESSKGSYVLTYTVPSGAAEAATAYQSQLTGAGFTVDESASVAGASTFKATGQGYEVVVLGLPTGLSITVQQA